MPVNQYTNDVMRALPSALRPNPYSIEEAVMQAIENGWDTDSLAKAAYANDKNPNPAFVVTNIRNLAQHPPAQQTQRQGWNYGHIPCHDHPGCEICRCEQGTLTHHQPIPMPTQFRTMLQQAMIRTEIPE